MTSSLIFDIGANNGDDTQFYLAKGFRVIAVEADPALAKALEKRFEADIAADRLVIENVGVAGAVGTMDFYVNSYNEWSSFVKKSKATTENDHRIITVDTVLLTDLLERHGTPYYLKMDIEGFEKQALRMLNTAVRMPDYLSFEVNSDWIDILSKLSRVGYKSFAIVRQGRDIMPDAPVPAREGHSVAQKFKDSMSGCFGKEISGPWLSEDDVITAMNHEAAQAKARLERGERRGWHDIHCRLGAPD